MKDSPPILSGIYLLRLQCTEATAEHLALEILMALLICDKKYTNAIARLYSTLLSACISRIRIVGKCDITAVITIEAR